MLIWQTVLLKIDKENRELVGVYLEISFTFNDFFGCDALQSLSTNDSQSGNQVVQAAVNEKP